MSDCEPMSYLYQHPYYRIEQLISGLEIEGIEYEYVNSTLTKKVDIEVSEHVHTLELFNFTYREKTNPIIKVFTNERPPRHLMVMRKSLAIKGHRGMRSDVYQVILGDINANFPDASNSDLKSLGLRKFITTYLTGPTGPTPNLTEGKLEELEDMLQLMRFHNVSFDRIAGCTLKTLLE